MTVRDCVCPKARHVHGTLRAYNADRCRCLTCRAAHANAARTYRNGGTWREAYVDAGPTKQQLRALAAVGVTSRRVAAHMGVSIDMVSYLRAGKRNLITPANAAAVDAAFNALWLRGRADSDARRCSTQARSYGYTPAPGDDDNEDMILPEMGNTGISEELDEIAIEEAIRGRRVNLTRGELAEAMRRLNEAGASARDISERLGVTTRTVCRKRAA